MEEVWRQLTSHSFKLVARAENLDRNFYIHVPMSNSVANSVDPPSKIYLKDIHFFPFNCPGSTHHYSGMNSYASFLIVFCCHCYPAALFHTSQEWTFKKPDCSFHEYLSGTYISRHWNRRQTRSVSSCSPHLAGGDRKQARKFQAVITAGNEIK